MQQKPLPERGAIKLLIKKLFRPQMSFILGMPIFLVMFQNCSGAKGNAPGGTANGSTAPTTPEVVFTPPTDVPPTIDLNVCDGVSCSLIPITKKAAVTTILLALGDELQSELVIRGSSAQLIAETVVRSTSPVNEPKILVVRDIDTQNESPEDTTYVADVLLARYNPTFMIEPAGGLQLSDTVGYDLIWFNNPGQPMSLESTYKTLLAFKGGVVMQGDDLSWGRNFSMKELTHLENIDNGTQVTCEGQTYNIDNNAAGRYEVTLDSERIPALNPEDVHFYYSNDMDNTKIAYDDVEVLAMARPDIASCQESRPAIVRYFRP